MVATSANEQKAKSQPTSSATRGAGNNASFTTDCHIICRNFNWQWGCQLAFCNFAHVCNHKVSGKACGQTHPNFQHNTAVSDNKVKQAGDN